MPTSTDRKTLRQKVIKRLYSPRYPIVSTSTGTAANTTTITDSGIGAGLVDNDYYRAWVYIAETTTGSPAVGEVSRVTNQSATALTVSPAFTDEVQTGMDYELHYWFHPEVVNDVLDNILESLEFGIILPLTLIPDGSMEATGTTSWTASNASLAKNTTAANIINGTQSLAVTATAANGQARSTSVSLPPNTPVIASADVVITSGDQAKLILYDVTNSAEIETATSSATGPVRLQVNATTPATCEQVQLRLVSVNDTDVTYWDNAILLSQLQSTYTVPSDAEWSFDVKGVITYPQGRSVTGSGEEFSYRVFDIPPQFYTHFDIERQENAATAYRINLHTPPLRDPLWVIVDVDYPAFAGATAALKDADTTKAPQDVVVPLAVASLFDQRAEWEFLDGKDTLAEKLQQLADKVRRREVNPAYRQFRKVKTLVTGAMT